MLDEVKTIRCSGRLGVVGVGHPFRGDDGAGPAVVGRLRPTAQFLCVNGGSAPENYAESVARFAPNHVILVDAAEFGGRPGEIRFLPASEAVSSGLSSHAGSLSLLARYLEARAACQTHLLAIQPAATGFSRQLSLPVARAVRLCALALQPPLPVSHPQAGAGEAPRGRTDQEPPAAVSGPGGPWAKSGAIWPVTNDPTSAAVPVRPGPARW
jgi:hydrogenase 3 maturation protease